MACSTAREPGLGSDRSPTICGLLRTPAPHPPPVVTAPSRGGEVMVLKPNRSFDVLTTNIQAVLTPCGWREEGVVAAVGARPALRTRACRGTLDTGTDGLICGPAYEGVDEQRGKKKYAALGGPRAVLYTMC